MQIIYSFTTIAMLSLFFAALFSPSLAQGAKEQDIPLSIIKRIQKPFWGDLNQLRERRIIRVLVSYNRTNFFITKNGARGVEHDLLQAYENYLNRGPLRQRYLTQLVFIPVPSQQLIDKLIAGKGDIAAAGITILPEREAMVDFTNPYIKDIRVILASNKTAPEIKTLEGLSGKQIVVVAQSNHVIHLHKLNQILGKQGLHPIEIIQADPLLESEDLLDMVNANIYQLTIADNHIAEIWQKALPNLRLHQDIIFHDEGKIGWAINKNTPKLKASLNSFIHSYAKQGRLLGNIVYSKYFENTYWIKRPLTHDLLGKDPCLEHYFQLYAEFYDFDWFLIAAIAYQESLFDHSKTSHRGAVGIMQVKPSTANEPYINIQNIDQLENNIHAGVKYLAFLRDHFFSGSKFTAEESLNFTLAAYNAGPNRVRQMQRQALEAGLNPHKWFYNVEVIARRMIGHETVNYVSTVQKNQLFFRTSKELYQQRRQLLAEMSPPSSEGDTLDYKDNIQEYLGGYEEGRGPQFFIYPQALVDKL